MFFLYSRPSVVETMTHLGKIKCSATQLSQCTTSTPTHDLLPLVINYTSQFTENGPGGPSKSIPDSILSR